MKHLHSTSKKLFSAFTLIATFFSISTKAMASELHVITPENAAQLGVDFKSAERALRATGALLNRQEIGIRFYEESNQVDLSSLDGVSVSVDISNVSMPDTNEESGGR